MKRFILACGLVLAVAAAPAPPQRDLTFTSADASTIAGTLSWPAATGAATKVPAVILIAGSGPQDRDEKVGPNKTFAELAEALNRAGFATLRYDKRGVGASVSKTPVFSVTRQLFVDDIKAAVAAAAADPHVDPSRIYLAGHSEGGELALGAVLEGAPVRGVILLSPLPIPYMQILDEQIAREHITGAQLATLQAMLKKNATFLDSYAKIDPRVEIAQVNVPMLVVHGSKDIQVTGADLAQLLAAAKAANRNVTSQELENDNHLFATLPPSVPSTGLEYYAEHPLDPRLAAAMVAWLRANP